VSKFDFWASLISGISLLIIFIGLLAIFIFKNNAKNTYSLTCSQKVIIIENGVAQEMETTKTNFEDFIKYFDLKIYPEDKVALSLPFNICKGVIIKITRAPMIYLDIGGKETIVRSFQKKVKDLLKEKNITLGEKDLIEPSLDSLVKDKMKITIKRIGERIENQKIEIPYVLEEIPDPLLPISEKKIVQEGIPGEKEVIFKIISENGIDIKKEVLSEKIIKYPQKKIIVYGTSPPVISVRFGEISYHSENITATNYYKSGAILKITNLSNGKSIKVKVDYGCSNCGPQNRILDLALSSFQQICPPYLGVFFGKIEELAQ